MSAQEAPQKRPRGTQERPRDAQERPKDAQETPGRRPDPSKIEPGTPRDASWAHSSQEPLFERLPDQFLIVFCVARGRADMCFVWFFPYETLVGPCQHCKRACTKKPRKIRGSTLQNPLRTHPKPSKIVPRAPQDVQKTAKTSQNRLRSAPEAPKSEKKRPRTKNSANIVPTWQDFGLHFGRSWLPLKH